MGFRASVVGVWEFRIYSVHGKILGIVHKGQMAQTRKMGRRLLLYTIYNELNIEANAIRLGFGCILQPIIPESL